MTQMKKQRCRAVHNIIGNQGLIRAKTTGTIESETDNLGRHLINVQWDGSFTMYVFADEIEIVEKAMGGNKGDANLFSCRIGCPWRASDKVNLPPCHNQHRPWFHLLL